SIGGGGRGGLSVLVFVLGRQAGLPRPSTHPPYRIFKTLELGDPLPPNCPRPADKKRATHFAILPPEIRQRKQRDGAGPRPLTFRSRTRRNGPAMTGNYGNGGS